MATQFSHRLPSANRDRRNLLVPILIISAIVATALASIVWIENDISSLTRSFYLLPWTVLAGACVLAPSIYLLYVGKFDLFHPLVFAAWSYVFPAFVIGSLLIAFGWVSPYFLSFIDDPEYNLCLLYTSPSPRD